MFKDLDNIVSKEIMEALEFDLDNINVEEYEEIHYNPNVKAMNVLKVKKATREEVNRIIANSHKHSKRINSPELDTYLETKEAIQQEYEKRYKPNKTKICNQVQAKDFENKMIYRLRNVIYKEDNRKFIDILNFLKKSYKPYEYIIQEDKQFNIKKIYVLEENTFDKDLSSYSTRQLQDYLDNINDLLNENVDKIVLSEKILRNTYIDNSQEVLPTVYPDNELPSEELKKVDEKEYDRQYKAILKAIANPLATLKVEKLDSKFPIFNALKEYYLSVC